jgi:3-hydroxybutyryl-CoA dehydrogenase
MTEAVGVVGGGIMGAGIAEVAARSGCSVIVREIDDAACESTRERISASLQRGVDAGKISAEEYETVLGRLSFTTELDDLADRDVVVEAIVEDEIEKTKVFQALAKIVANPDAVLASNTSSIPIMKLAAATDTPERVLGIHFFNPVPVLPLVEVIPSLLTSEPTVERAQRFAELLGKEAVVCKDRAGFVVNALLIPYLLAAIRMVESGFATAEDIDAAMKAGCAHPMGPLALTDLIGLDTTAAVAQSMYAEFKEPLYAPPPLLLRMVEAGLLGRKRGRGFYEYG